MRNLVPSEVPDYQQKLLWAAAVPFAALLIYAVLPGLNVGFVSDDFVHLVEDVNLPWYASSDHLNRPFRDGLFRILPLLFGLNPLPYRLLAFVFYGLTSLLFFRLSRDLGAGRASALSATVLLTFFPRNYEDLFWFAAFQDLVVAACVLFACSRWLSYLRSGSLRSYFASILAYIAALGFKETAIGLPVVLICLELFASRDGARPSRWERIRPYILFAPIALAFAAYVVLAGSAASSFQSSKGIYVKTSIFGVLPPLGRTLVNIILPFSHAVSLRDLSIAQAGMVMLGCALIVLAAVTNRKTALFSVAWFLAFALPTAAFARAVNADRYLLLPYMGILFLLEAALDRIFPLRRWQSIAALAALLVYAAAGGLRLAHFRESIRAAARQVDTVSAEALQLLNREPGTEGGVVLVNLVHSTEVYVFNNGVKGALVERGLPRRAKVIYNFYHADSGQERLVDSLKSCARDSERPGMPVVLLFTGGQLADVSGSCASETYAADRLNRPAAWTESPAL